MKHRAWPGGVKGLSLWGHEKEPNQSPPGFALDDGRRKHRTEAEGIDGPATEHD